MFANHDFIGRQTFYKAGKTIESLDFFSEGCYLNYDSPNLHLEFIIREIFHYIVYAEPFR